MLHRRRWIGLARLALVGMGLVLMASAAGMALTPGTAESGSALTVMSFNIRTLMPSDGRNFWPFRKNQVAALIQRNQPDLLGLQEVFTVQAQDLAKRLPAYQWFGPGREDGKNQGERCPIFYRSDRLTLLEHNTFWLSPTPEKAGTRFPDAAFPRIVTWGKFKDRVSGQEIFYFNTHFDHLGEEARALSARLFVERIRKLAGDLPVVVTGDFNAADQEPPYQTMTSLLADSRKISSSAPTGPLGTTRDFALDSPIKDRIDYIFVSSHFAVLDYAALDDTYGQGRRPSDHLPVKVKIIIP